MRIEEGFSAFQRDEMGRCLVKEVGGAGSVLERRETIVASSGMMGLS